MTQISGGVTKPLVRVFGSWFSLDDQSIIKPIEQAETETEMEPEAEQAEEAMATDGTELEKPNKLTKESIGTTSWSSNVDYIIIDARLSCPATGGRSPRIISLASTHLGGDGSTLASIHEYVKIEVAADSETVQKVHGRNGMVLQ